MIETIVGEHRIRHGGEPPFIAKSASDKADDWPFWMVLGKDGVNRISFPDRRGTVFLSKADAIAVAEALNGGKT